MKWIVIIAVAFVLAEILLVWLGIRITNHATRKANGDAKSKIF